MKIWLLVLCVLLAGCRLSNGGKEVPNKDSSNGAGNGVSSSAPVVQPQKQSGVGQTLNVTIDAAGKVNEVLVLRLDYFPQPQSGGVSVPSCYDKITGQLVVARLVCGSNGNLSMDVTASQVNQQCYTSSPAKVIAANSSIVLAGCVGAAVLQLVPYSPDIKLEIKR
jgi:hypothetical protein